MPYKNEEERKAYSRQYYKLNKEKLDKQRSEWAKNNLDRKRAIANKYAASDRDRQRFQKMMSRYGISSIQYQSMLESQDFKCLGCLKEFEKTPNIDHCHTTGKVRGLLCNNCNRGIGHLKEDIDTMLRLIGYLKRSKDEG